MGPDRLSQVVAALLRLMIVMMLLALVVVEAGRVPGVDWGKIKVWEGSALDECWDLLSEFDQFRTHLLRGLSDLGLLDHPLDDWNGTLKVLDGVGGKTGVIITKLSASASAGGTSGQTGTSTAPEDAGGLTLKAMRVKSLEFIRRLLRGGPILDMLELMVDEKGDPSNFNPLVFLYALDLRFRPENDQETKVRMMLRALRTRVRVCVCAARARTLNQAQISKIKHSQAHPRLMADVPRVHDARARACVCVQRAQQI